MGMLCIIKTFVGGGGYGVVSIAHWILLNPKVTSNSTTFDLQHTTVAVSPLEFELKGLSLDEIRERLDEFRSGDSSGDLICVGRPTDKTAKALLFQNFDTTPDPGMEQTHYNIRGGFVLPSYIYNNCTIHHTRQDTESHGGENEYLERPSRESTETLRAE